MLEYSSSLTKIEIEGALIRARVCKQIVDGDTVHKNEPHLVTFEPGANIASYMAMVNDDLGSMGYPPISGSDIAKLEALAAVAWA